MDTQAPTTFDKVEHQIEEGLFAPAPTPADSQSTHSSSRHPRKRRSGLGVVAHVARSPLQVNSSRSRTPHSGTETPDEHSDGDSPVDPSSSEKGRSRRISRRSRFSSKRHSKKETANSIQQTQKTPSKSWVANMRRSRYNPSIVLKNSGSVARDHLASERTFLAYVRTSMGLASMGVALVQLFAIAEITSRALGTDIPTASPDVQRFARPLGALTIAFSFVVLLIGLYRYFKIQFALPGGNFPIARISISFTSFVFAAIIVTMFGAVLSGRSHT